MGTPSRSETILGTNTFSLEELSLQERCEVVTGLLAQVKPILKYVTGARELHHRFNRIGWVVRDEDIVSYPEGLDRHTRHFRLYHTDKRENTTKYEQELVVFELLLTESGQFLTWEAHYHCEPKEGYVLRNEIGYIEVAHSAVFQLIDDDQLRKLLEESWVMIMVIKTLAELLEVTIEQRRQRLESIRATSAFIGGVMSRLGSWNHCHGERQD